VRLGGEYIVKVVGLFDTPSQINRTAVVLLMPQFSVVNTDGAGVDGRADGPGSRVAELIGA